MLKLSNNLYEFGPYRLDPVRRLLWRAGARVPLRAKAFDTLLTLVRSQGRLLDKDELIREVWGETIVEESGLARNISELRKTLGESLEERRYIVTAPGRGYRFVAEVREIAFPIGPVGGLDSEEDEGEVIEETHTISRIISQEEVIEAEAVERDASPKALPGSAPRPSHATAQLVATGAANELERITGLALHEDRDQRYQTSNELLLDLKKLRGQSAAPAAVSDLSARFGSSGAAAPNKPRQLPQVAAIVLAVVAAIGAAVYFAFNRAPVHTTGPLRVMPFSSLPGTETEPAFSPDGNQLAFVWDGGQGGQTDIYIKLIGVGTPLRLTNNPAYEIAPTWSPDGRHIAFIRREGAQNAVMIVPALGGPERKLCAGSQNTYRLSWSPDGQWLATAAERPDNPNISQIVLVSLSTGEQRYVTNPPPGDGEYLAAFSPDGRQLAFVRDSAQTGSDLYLTTIIAGQAQGEKRLTTGSRTINGLAWTVDGRELIYDSNHLGNSTLWRVSSAGGEPQLLFSGGAIYGLPAVARQGGRLAFTESKVDSNIRRIELPDAVRAGRRGRVEIRWEAMTKLVSSAREDGSPQYSPDGKKIAFTSNRSGSMEIWVCASDGSNPLQLTNLPGAYTGSPHWSPDGRYLVFDARPDTRSDLFVINAEGGAPRRLTNDSFYNVIPSWSRDGAWIYFCSRRSGTNQIWKMPAAGGSAVQITRKGGFEALEAPDGKTIYYSKERGGDGLWTVPSVGGEEQRVPELTEAGYWRSWTMTNDGIYFVASVGFAPPRPLKFFHFATRRITQLGTVDRDPLWWGPSLSVSADGRWVLYAHSEQNTSNIMLVESFR